MLVLSLTVYTDRDCPRFVWVHELCDAGKFSRYRSTEHLLDVTIPDQSLSSLLSRGHHHARTLKPSKISGTSKTGQLSDFQEQQGADDEEFIPPIKATANNYIRLTRVSSDYWGRIMAALDSVAKLTDQKQKIEQYRLLLNDFLASGSRGKCQNFVDHSALILQLKRSPIALHVCIQVLVDMTGQK